MSCRGLSQLHQCYASLYNYVTWYGKSESNDMANYLKMAWCTAFQLNMKYLGNMKEVFLNLQHLFFLRFDDTH